jgi:hypothetical protein
LLLAIAILGQSNYFWCEGHDTHIITLPELAGYRAEYAGSSWLICCIQQYHGIVIEADIRTVFTADFFFSSNNNSLGNEPFLEATWSCIFNGNDDFITN